MNSPHTPPTQAELDEWKKRIESNLVLRLIAEVERLRAEVVHPWAKALSKKYLDPECSDGCQSLKHKHENESAHATIASLTTQLFAATKENSEFQAGPSAQALDRLTTENEELRASLKYSLKCRSIDVVEIHKAIDSVMQKTKGEG